MKKKSALSPVGIAIAIVMLLGMLMIISAPVIVENNKKSNDNQPVKPEFYEQKRPKSEYRNINSDYEAKIQYLESRIYDLENRMENKQNTTSTKNYNCTLESALDANGETIQLTKENYNNPSIEYVFVCNKK